MRVAAVDIGTNTVRLLVADVSPPGQEPRQVVERERRAEVVRLGAGVDATGRLDPAALDRTVAALSRFGDAIRSWGCATVRAVATSAVRDAENRDELLDRAERALGSRPQTIGGETEAALAFAGATAAASGPPPFLIIDVGGGSTEFVLGSERPEFVASVDIGSVRLTERSLPSRPAGLRELAEARREVADMFAAQVALPGPAATVIGVAGTFTSLAAIHLGLAVEDPERIHRAELSPLDLHELVDRLAQMTVAETAALPSLDPARAPVLLGGAVVAAAAVVHTATATLVVSTHDTLDGVVLATVSG